MWLAANDRLVRFRLAFRTPGCLLVALLAVAGCSPPHELVGRPPTVADVTATSLLPPGQLVAVTHSNAVDAAGVTTPDGGSFTAVRFAASGEAETQFVRERDRRLAHPDLVSSSSIAVGNVQYARYATAELSGLVWLSGTWLLVAEARDARMLFDLIAASRAGGMEALPTGLIVGVPVLALVLLVALMFGGLRLLVRSLAVRPAAGTPMLDREDLVRHLLALNTPDQPWLVRAGPEADLVIEWKFADATWWGVLAKSGVRKIYRLRLYLDARTRRCSALDEFGELEWTVGALGAPRVHFDKRFFRGVQLIRYERGMAYGLRKPFSEPDKVLDYKFNIDDLKQSVIDAVTTCGWTYQPILWPRRRTEPLPD